MAGYFVGAAYNLMRIARWKPRAVSDAEPAVAWDAGAVVRPKHPEGPERGHRERYGGLKREEIDVDKSEPRGKMESGNKNHSSAGDFQRPVKGSNVSKTNAAVILELPNLRDLPPDQQVVLMADAFERMRAWAEPFILSAKSDLRKTAAIGGGIALGAAGLAAVGIALEGSMEQDQVVAAGEAAVASILETQEQVRVITQGLTDNAADAIEAASAESLAAVEAKSQEAVGQIHAEQQEAASQINTESQEAVGQIHNEATEAVGQVHTATSESLAQIEGHQQEALSQMHQTLQEALAQIQTHFQESVQQMEAALHQHIMNMDHTHQTHSIEYDFLSHQRITEFVTQHETARMDLADILQRGTYELTDMLGMNLGRMDEHHMQKTHEAEGFFDQLVEFGKVTLDAVVHSGVDFIRSNIPAVQVVERVAGAIIDHDTEV